MDNQELTVGNVVAFLKIAMDVVNDANYECRLRARVDGLIVPSLEYVCRRLETTFGGPNGEPLLTDGPHPKARQASNGTTTSSQHH